MPVILYNLPGSPPCGFVRCVAKHIGVDLKVRNVDFGRKEHLGDEYRKTNPLHKVPTIDDDGFIIYESSAIVHYLLRKYAPKSQLYPDDVKTRARIDQVVAAVSATIQPQASGFYRPRLLLKIKSTAEEEADFEENVVKGFQQLLGGSQYAVGDMLTLADLALVSHLTLALEIDCVDLSKYPKLVSYYERMKSELPYFEEIFGAAIRHVKEEWAELKQMK
ncbi:hypothetical protein HPB50_001854 [Hyalomma asiaticum]|uniref:Uncharacterized protein n=1 Tax=Hyalomma asiaticum TaxID=266040 RepID=A0ACB7SDI7_HYAAI|nr:hypothetical protein HPB50_001854 [Hyalomma asiaticum]